MSELLRSGDQHGSNLCILRVFRLRAAQKTLKTDQGALEREYRAPLLAQGVQTDRSGLTADIRVPDAGDEPHLWGLERVLGCDADVDVVFTAIIRRIWWPGEVTVEMGEVCEFGASRGRADRDSGVGVLEDILDLLLKAAVTVGSTHGGLGGVGELLVE